MKNQAELHIPVKEPEFEAVMIIQKPDILQLKQRVPRKNRGCSRLPLYRVWTSMISRCNDPRRPDYYRYGGRGITVCPRWLNSLKDFCSDMGERPTPKHTIERIDNDGNYELSNCRWATMKEQSLNTSSNHRVEYAGEVKTLFEWSVALGLNYSTLNSRFQRGWSPRAAFETPILSNATKWNYRTHK